MDSSPSGIISRIFSYINQDDLYEPMKVCKKWHQEGSLKYYRQITLEGHHVRFLELCNKITHLNGSHIGDFVEELTFCSSEDTPKEQVLTQEQFGLLI